MELSPNKVHVLVLKPRDQFVLRLLLFNLMSGYIERKIGHAASGRNSSDECIDLTLHAFNMFNSITDELTPESMITKAKSKMLMIEPIMMQHIVAAVNGYNEDDNYLSSEHRRMANMYWKTLYSQVQESKLHLYTRTEIHRVRDEE